MFTSKQGVMRLALAIGSCGLIGAAIVATRPVSAQGVPETGASFWCDERREDSIRDAYVAERPDRDPLAVDRSTPTVAVDAWYHVGSKNELPGRTGFAHLFEHVMFTGSGHAPYGLHDKLTGGIGGSNNGTTNNDRTTYYETVPSNYLEDQIWLEADRMGFLLDKLDIAKLNAQREIVKNERRERVDNQPYGRASETSCRPRRLSRRQSVFVGRHRQHGRSLGGVGRRREELFPAVLRAEQRDAHGRR